MAEDTSVASKDDQWLQVQEVLRQLPPMDRDLILMRY